jgi:uncharacterized tellurite resistance protein B-like protein
MPLASLLRFLGLGPSSGAKTDADTETVRRIAGKLERLEPGLARYVAAFAYVLARVASADLRVCETETAQMEQLVGEIGGLTPDAAALAVEIAKSQARLLGGTENYVVTREFRRIATASQRADGLRCLFAVAAADGTISAAESAEIQAIGEELGFTRAEVNAVRAQFKDKLSELR